MNKIISKYPYIIYLNNISCNYFYNNIYISDYYYKNATHTLDQALNNIELESYLQYAKDGIINIDIINNLSSCISLDLINIINVYSTSLISKNFRDDIFKLCDMIVIYKKKITIYRNYIYLNDKYFSIVRKHKYKYILCLKDIIISLYKDNICLYYIENINFITTPNILIYNNDGLYINKPLKKLTVNEFTYSVDIDF
jgi:hypothetical protein